MPRIQGTSVIKFDSEAPITLKGAWNVTAGIPTYRGYGQGDGSAGSGYQGAAKGTGQKVSGSFVFVVDKGGQATRNVLRKGFKDFFTADWPVGDPALGAVNGRAIDCTFDSIKFDVDNPEGRFEISGEMSAGAVEGPIFDTDTP
jgi:hypothetical protein